MIPYFVRTGEDQQLLGDRTCLDTIQNMFAQDEQGGMIEVSLSPGEQLVYLYLAGHPVAIYHIAPWQATLCNLSQAAVLLPAEITIRYLKLPVQAIRAIWQALAWYPPVRGARLDGQTLRAYLDALRVERVEGLLHIILLDMDGFLFLQNGELVRNETVLASARGFFDTLPNSRAQENAMQGSCEVWLSELRPGGPATALAHLRIAFLTWVSHWLSAYQRLVGYNLIVPVNQSVNTWMQYHRYNMRMIGGALVEHHLFLQLAPAVEAYQGLVEVLDGCLSQVIGDHLVARMAAETLNGLTAAQQRVLGKQGVVQAYL